MTAESQGCGLHFDWIIFWARAFYSGRGNKKMIQ